MHLNVISENMIQGVQQDAHQYFLSLIHKLEEEAFSLMSIDELNIFQNIYKI